jgi:hypothetical protein
MPPAPTPATAASSAAPTASSPTAPNYLSRHTLLPSVPLWMFLLPLVIHILPHCNFHLFHLMRFLFLYLIMIMCTRAKRDFHLPVRHLNLTATSSISPIPTTYKHALLDPLWHSSMRDEFDALLQNNTWTLVPKPPCANVVSGKWVSSQVLCRGFSCSI